MAKKKAGPDEKSMAYKAMEPIWERTNAVLGGTDSMRAAGKTLLPQHPGEDDERYNERLSRAVLWNQSEITLNSWASKPFTKEVKLLDDVPDEIRDLKSNIDLQGTNLTVFCERWFRTGLAKAFCHVLIDYPTIAEKEDGSPRNLEDDRRERLRPYWVHIDPESVLSARAEIIAGEEEIVDLRIYEPTVEQDPEDEFREVVAQRIRRFQRIPSQEDGSFGPGDAVMVTVYLYVDSGPQKGWAIESETSMGLGRIPLVTFYADRDGLMTGKPPLLDLVDLNIDHWQERTDQKSCLTVARFPILAATGIDDDDPKATGKSKRKVRVISPYKMLTSENERAKFYYVEHTGTALGAGEASLDKLEQKMSAYGTEFLKKKPDRMTASARMLDSKEALSPLQAMALLFQQALKRALDFTAAWVGLEDGGSAEVVTDFNLDEGTSQMDLTTLVAARQKGDISREAFLRELHRRRILSEDFDFEANTRQVEDEAMKLVSMAASIDIDSNNEEKAPQ